MNPCPYLFPQTHANVTKARFARKPRYATTIRHAKYAAPMKSASAVNATAINTHAVYAVRNKYVEIRNAMNLAILAWNARQTKFAQKDDALTKATLVPLVIQTKYASAVHAMPPQILAQNAKKHTSAKTKSATKQTIPA